MNKSKQTHKKSCVAIEKFIYPFTHSKHYLEEIGIIFVTVSLPPIG